MKNLTQYLAIKIISLICITSVISCSKEDLDLFSNPADVEQTIVTLIDIDSVEEESALARAKVTDSRKGVIDHVGFCYSSENRLPNLYDYQVLLEGKEGDFEHIFSGLKADTTYYIRAFAITKYGIFYSSVRSIRLGFPKPVVPNCQLVLGKIEDGSGFKYNVTNVYSNYDLNPYKEGYSFEVNFSSGQLLYFTFENKPNNGVYKTVKFRSDLPNEKRIVWVYVRYGFGQMTIANPFSEVFVTKNLNGTYEVTFCNVSYKIETSGSPLTLNAKGRFLVP